MSAWGTHNILGGFELRQTSQKIKAANSHEVIKPNMPQATMPQLKLTHLKRSNKTSWTRGQKHSKISTKDFTNTRNTKDKITSRVKNTRNRFLETNLKTLIKKL
jgi:type 1 fimbria pilin